LEKTKVYRGM